ncbi:MAG: acyltransferase [Gemmatimonadetes bacterium]|nr:acyltransferase [Gemmatimonadota bacterium]
MKTRTNEGREGTGAAARARFGFLQLRPRFGRPEENLASAAEAIEHAPEFDVLVLPELFASGYAFRDRAEALAAAEDAEGPTARFLRETAARRGAWLAAGYAERDGNALYNSARLTGPRGETSVYRKVHLFDREREIFDPGDRPFRAVDLRVPAGVLRAGLMICYDWRFPESARSLALDGAEVLLHPSNLVLPNCQDAMIVRCLENRVYSVTANRTGTDDRGDFSIEFTGRSRIVGPDGAVLATAPVDADALEIVEVNLAAARDKRINARNDLWRDRRPEAYRRER